MLSGVCSANLSQDRNIGTMAQGIRRTLIAISLLLASGLAASSLSAQSRQARVRPVPATGGVHPAICAPVFEDNRRRWPAKLPHALETSRNLYLLGKCHLERANYRDAERYFRLGLDSAPALAAHWRFKLLHAAMDGGNTPRALELLGMLLAAPASAELADDLRGLLTERREGRSPQSAEADYQYLSTFFAAVEATPEDYDLLVYLDELAKGFNDGKLRARVRVVQWQVPKDKQSALAGARALPAPRLKAALYLKRMRNLYDLRLFSQIVKELEAPRLPRWSAEEAREIGSTYFLSLIRTRKYHHAAKQIENRKMVKRFHFRREDVLRIAIQVHLRRRSVSTAIKLLRKLEVLHPQEENLAGFNVEVARYYQERNNPRAMIAWCRRVLDKYPGQPAAATAYWLLIWEPYIRGDYEQAAEWSERAIANTQQFSAETRSRYHYWRGRILMALGRKEEGLEVWREMQSLWPTSYYGLMVRHWRNGGPVAPRFSPVPSKAIAKRPPPILKAVWEEELLRSAVFLFIVGEEERAAAMMGGALGRPMADGLLRELGQVFQYFNRYRLQYRITANYFYSDLKRRPVSDTSVWRHAYPLAFWENVLAETSSQDLSPFFVLAVMREESNFHAAADSRAGAKGLMQLMPSTARMVARRNRLPYDEAALTHPEFNITLGTLYLKGVLKRYKWDPVLAAASYNAGPNAVKKWRRKFRGLPVDEFVERIPYDETRRYVKRVMSSYLIYRDLYHPASSRGAAPAVKSANDPKRTGNP